MNAHDLADWIDKNYPRLSPYLKTSLENLQIGLIENNTNSALCLLYIEHFPKNDSWASSGIRDIEPGKYPRVGDAPSYFGQSLKRGTETDEDFLNKMKSICEGCIEIIDWYESLPYEEDRNTLRELGFKSRTLQHPIAYMANNFAADIIIEFPEMQHLCYKAKIGKWDSNKADWKVTLFALTLDELLQKIVKGEIE